MDAQLKKEIKELIENEFSSFEFDEPEEITKVAKQCEVFEEKHKNIEGRLDLVEQLSGKLEQWEKKITGLSKEVETAAKKLPREVVVKAPALPKAGKKFNVVHKQFEQVMRWVTARDQNGFPIPTWLYGHGGGGKTHIAMQIAESLGVDFYPISFGPTTTDGKVVGFVNAAIGKYVPALGRDWYEKGGLFYCDEIDAAEPSALVSLNSLVANSVFRFPDGKLIKRNKNTYILAGANTLGTGATAGYRRQSQDAASRSRWAKVKFEYDEAMEAKLAPVESWVKYVQKVRAQVELLAKSTIHITPRDSIIGAAALLNGVPANEVVDHLFSEFSEDAKRQVLESVGTFTFSGKSKNN